jgi:hypothetical protein
LVSPTQLQERDRQEAANRNEAAQQPQMSRLASHIRTRWEEMRNHRNSAMSGSGWGSLNNRLLAAMRAFNGEYAPDKLQMIKQFGGSEVYAKIIGNKCRGATALLREVYLGGEKSWGLQPTPDPVVPDTVVGEVANLLAMEVDGQMRAQQPVDQMAVRQRAQILMDGAMKAAKVNAEKEAKEADDRLNDILVEGKFYQALAELIVDVPLFPFVCLKGPTVRVVWAVKWEGGKPASKQIPRMFWDRVSPFDIYWSPGASKPEDAEFCEKVRLTRAGLSEVMDLPGYNRKAISEVLEAHGRGGLYDWMDSVDTERAQQEGRESPVLNRSHFIDTCEFHGSVQGNVLEEWGFDLKKHGIDDPEKDVSVQAWLIDRWVVKVQLTPSPRRRPPYFITSFEKVPGTVAGNALPDVLDDIQDVCNAVLRQLVNNLAMASGPQVVVQTDRLAPGCDPTTLHPWKRWYVTADPILGTTEKPPITFWQANSHAQELLGVYKEMSNIADELSAIPKYITGSERMGGAGRTASGLAMLMGNANKLLQTVCANIDGDIIEPALSGLYDMVMLVDAGVKLRGDENILVRGVALAQKREMERQRQLEFLRITANPIDMQAMGMAGRSKVLRAVSDGLGLEGQDIVPDPEELKAAMGAAAEPGAPPPMPPGKGAPAPASQQGPPGAIQGPSTNLVQPGPTTPGAPVQGA